MNLDELIKSKKEKMDKIQSKLSGEVFPFLAHALSIEFAMLKRQVDELEGLNPVNVEYNHKVKLSKFAAEWYKLSKNRGYSLFGALNHRNGMDNQMKLWLVDYRNQELFAKAWIDGYEIEDETWEVRLKFNDKEAAEAYANIERGEVVKVEEVNHGDQ